MSICASLSAYLGTCGYTRSGHLWVNVGSRCTGHIQRPATYVGRIYYVRAFCLLQLLSLFVVSLTSLVVTVCCNLCVLVALLRRELHINPSMYVCCSPLFLFFFAFLCASLFSVSLSLSHSLTHSLSLSLSLSLSPAVPDLSLLSQHTISLVYCIFISTFGGGGCRCGSLCVYMCVCVCVYVCTCVRVCVRESETECVLQALARSRPRPFLQRHKKKNAKNFRRVWPKRI